MRLTFLGAAEEVTGSMFLLELESGTILIDCGMFQGRRAESRQRNRELPAEAVAADAMILTHSHIDHSGNLPTLVKAGFAGSIHTTMATYDLCAYMLRDSARIQEADAKYLNRKFADDPDFDPVVPLYDDADAVRALERFVAVPYHRSFTPIPNVTATLLNAGHILGSAEVVLDVNEHGQHRRLVFSGDLGRAGLPIIRDPEYPPGPVDYVVMECTYGNRVHGSVLEMHDDLERIVRDTVARGGKVIVPAFAVGRTQELLYVLHELILAKRLPPIPIYIDSPLATNATEVFRMHPEVFDTETRKFLDEHGDVFAFEGVHFVRDTEASIALNGLDGPAIIISASGMCEAGRILHHLRHHVEDDRDTIVIVGFMAQHTLGRRLAERRPRVKIWGVERDLRARVEVLDSFSAHADQHDLLAFADACGPATRRFFLVHGEPAEQAALRDAMTARGMTVHVPHRHETVVLD
ncbi:MAG: Metallo-beta-lactamase family protein, RNA-specific [Deltaproteobacteria bacterium]|nr:Metallo-beta-lactamase family protein, RNA-specific [Deltaproteobacteria bacterium]